MIVPNLNTCSASRPLFRVIPIIAIISLLAAAVFAPNTEARRGGWEGIPPVELGTAGNYKVGIFHKDALALAMMQDIKIETQRDASLRGTEIVATAVYGVGEIHDSYGVELHVNSSIIS